LESGALRPESGAEKIWAALFRGAAQTIVATIIRNTEATLSVLFMRSPAGLVSQKP